MKKAKSRLNYKKDWRDHRLTPIIIFAITILLCIVAKLGGGIFDVRAMEIEEVEYKKPVIVKTGEEEYSEKQLILSYIVEVFGDDADDAITLINKCENSAFNPNAQNWNRNGSVDTGIFQVNSIHGYSEEYLKNWKNNIDVAKTIFDNRGWSAWSCAEVVGVRPFWK